MKKFFAFVLAVCMILSLVACVKTPENTTPSDSATVPTEDTTAPEQPTEPETPQTFLWDNFDNRDPEVKPDTAPNGANLWWDNWKNLTAENDNGAIKLVYSPKEYDPNDKAGDWMSNWGEAVDMWSLADIAYCKYLTIRVKGEAGGEEAKLLMDWHPIDAKFYAARFSDLVLKDGTHPKITTEWQDLVIDLEASGFPGMTDNMHIRAFASCTIWIDEIYFSEPVAPVDTSSSDAVLAGLTAAETGKPAELPINTYLKELGVLTNNVSGVSSGGTTNSGIPSIPTVSQTFLWDNFNDRDPKVTPSKSPNGATLWWDNWYNLNAANDNGAMKINYTPLAYNPNDKTGEWMGNWGEGIDMWSLSGISNCKYLTIRVKGNAGGEEAKLLLDFRTGEKAYVVRFSDLVLKDGTHPKITTEWQDLVIDLKKSGLPGMTDRMHIRAFASCTIWLDEIIFSEPTQTVWTPVVTGQPGELPIKTYLEELGGTTNPGESTVTTVTYLWDNFDNRDPSVTPATAPSG
ncbi:MAG: hypothetical protein IJX67_02850, partial [Oscillospiraceae bacterium]|nr:hypothetical protein [Oscillospiraceae bacterium]